jgi:hypothetical protein
MAVRGLIVAVVLALGAGACTTGSTPTGSAADVATALPPTSALPSEASPQATPAAIVGEWVGLHECQRIVSMLKDAGLDDFIAEQVNGNGLIPGVDAESDTLDPSSPCAEAVPRKHSHFFTADGRFGSKDNDGSPVDDGRYTLEGEDVVIINGTPFQYAIDGDELTLDPPDIDISDCTTNECRFLAVWVRMVAMPGTTWTRGRVTD